MTQISPLLQSRLDATKNPSQVPNNKHEKIYQDLQKRAHEAKPNEAKAVMVKEGILGNPITATKDMMQDSVNFVKTVKTGQIGDNNLGRINDLGLKVGAGLIAAFLATHAKTKTEAIMQFVGGGTFLAAMSLWPKLFINLPARLVHGFRIDRKYISAQGDKKDFFLDNQFLVWDAYPEEQLRKDAKNAGIDYDAKNGKEKIQRKMQKTALQNRTLWMATAGFATPLLTSMFGDFITPKVQKAVVDHDVKKSKAIVEGGIKQHLDAVKVKPTNTKQLETLIGSYSDKQVDKPFFEELAKLLSLDDIASRFRYYQDDTKAARSLSSHNLIENLQATYEDVATISKKDLFEAFPELQEAAKTAQEGEKAVSQTIGDYTGAFAKAMKKAGANIVIEGTDGEVVDEKAIAKKAGEMLQTAFGDKEQLTIKQIRETLGASYETEANKLINGVRKNDGEFFEFIKKYNSEIVSALKAKADAYIKMLNPVVGATAESQYTMDFHSSMKKIFSGLGVSDKDLKAFREVDDAGAISRLSDMFKAAIGKTKDSEQAYKEFLQKIVLAPSDDKTLVATIEAMANPENIHAIAGATKIGDVDVTRLNESILGVDGNFKGLYDLIKDYIGERGIDTQTIKSKAMLCANFERRVAQGAFKDILDDSELEIARKFIYDGTISTVKNQGEINDKEICKKIINTLFDKTAFNATEKEAMPNIESIVDNLKTIFTEKALAGNTPTKDYLSCPSAEKLIKDYASNLGNNRAWMKIFGSMTVALVAITLLVQPLFGKIDKEFPKEGKNGGAK